MGKVEKIVEEIMQDEEEIRELLSKESIEDLYEFFLTKDRTLTEEEFDNEVYDILEYYSKNIDRGSKELEESEIEQIAGGKGDFIKKSIALPLTALTLGFGMGPSTYALNSDVPVKENTKTTFSDKLKKLVNRSTDATKRKFNQISGWMSKNKDTVSKMAVASAGALLFFGVCLGKASRKKSDRVPEQVTPDKRSNLPILPLTYVSITKKSDTSTPPPVSSESSAPAIQSKKDKQQPPKPPTATPAAKPNPAKSIMQQRIQAAKNAEDDAEKNRAYEIQRQLSSRLKICENLVIAAGKSVWRVESLANKAKSRADGMNNADVVAKLEEVNKFVKKAQEAAQKVQEAAQKAREAKNLEALETAKKEVKAAKAAVERAEEDAGLACRQLNACLNEVAKKNGNGVNPEIASNSPENGSASTQTPAAKFEPSTVDILNRDAENSIPKGIVGDGVAAIKGRGGDSAGSPEDKLTQAQKERLKKAERLEYSRRRGAEILEIADSYNGHEEEINRSLEFFKLVRKENFSQNEISLYLKRFQEEQLEIGKCFKSLDTIMKNFEKYEFRDLTEYYRKIVDVNREKYSKLFESSEKKFMEECKDDIKMANSAQDLMRELKERISQIEVS